MRLQLVAKQCPRRNTVKHGQRVKPRQNDLGLCGDESGQLTENASHFPFDLKIRHFDRIVQFDKLARFKKHRDPAGRDVMDDPRTLHACRLSPDDIRPSLWAKYCSCRMSS